MTSSITGRDGYILTRALAYAISAITALPTYLQARSDLADMQALLRARCPVDGVRENFLAVAQEKLAGDPGMIAAGADRVSVEAPH